MCYVVSYLLLDLDMNTYLCLVLMSCINPSALVSLPYLNLCPYLIWSNLLWKQSLNSCKCAYKTWNLQLVFPPTLISLFNSNYFFFFLIFHVKPFHFKETLPYTSMFSKMSGNCSFQILESTPHWKMVANIVTGFL